MDNTNTLSPPSCVIDFPNNDLNTKDFDWKNKGYKMTSISGYNLTDPVFAAVWDSRNGNEYTFKTDMTSPEFQQEFDNWKTKGWWLQWVDGYEKNGEIMYAAIWENSENPEYFSRHGLSPEQFEETCTEFTAQGFSPVHISGYSTNGTSWFAGIWHKNSGTPTNFNCDLTLDSFEEFNTEMINKGMTLHSLNGWITNDEPKFAGVWTETNENTNKYDIALPAEDFEVTRQEMWKLGFHPVSVCGYTYRDKNFFTVIWRDWEKEN
ncbi:MAG: hypothetical protein IIA45_09715 [Bacteroidetes bacterium]|nr:hypothetical protein [Bacteroidota bacterium]